MANTAWGVRALLRHLGLAPRSGRAADPANPPVSGPFPFGDRSVAEPLEMVSLSVRTHGHRSRSALHAANLLLGAGAAGTAFWRMLVETGPVSRAPLALGDLSGGRQRHQLVGG